MDSNSIVSGIHMNNYEYTLGEVYTEWTVVKTAMNGFTILLGIFECYELPMGSDTTE